MFNYVAGTFSGRDFSPVLKHREADKKNERFIINRSLKLSLNSLNMEFNSFFTAKVVQAISINNIPELIVVQHYKILPDVNENSFLLKALCACAKKLQRNEFLAPIFFFSLLLKAFAVLTRFGVL